jgi:nucleoid-associated protein YgaU
MIGIKIANGEFYPILAEDGSTAKRLVLTTVKDDQQTVHIDLYRGEGEDFSNPSYLGSLVIDGISGRPKQVPDIELTLAVDESGELKARAADNDSGASRSLTVALTQGSAEPEFTMPDFELDTEPDLALEEPLEEPRHVPASSLTQLRDDDEEEEETAEPDIPVATPSKAAEFTKATQSYQEEPPRRSGLSPLILALIIVAGLAILLLFGFLIYRCASTAPAAKPSPSPSVSASPEPSASVEASPSVPASPSPSPSAVASASPAPESGADLLGKNGSKGLTIRITWGDTLWDLATRYYGNPWLYKKIAKANKIKNPNLIISGHKLWIPPR